MHIVQHLPGTVQKQPELCTAGSALQEHQTTHLALERTYAWGGVLVPLLATLSAGCTSPPSALSLEQASDILQPDAAVELLVL